MARRKARARKRRGAPPGAPEADAEKAPPVAKAPQIDYEGPDGSVLTLRASLTVGARREYAQALAGHGARAAASKEDIWHRASELLFERLAVRWVIAGAPIERERELLARYRAASSEERAFVRSALREHCAEWFPDVEAP